MEYQQFSIKLKMFEYLMNKKKIENETNVQQAKFQGIELNTITRKLFTVN